MRVRRMAHRSLLGFFRDVVDNFAAATPARFAISIFAGLVILFHLLLGLPISNSTAQFTPLVDAFFTAVSVICVTGLTTVDMATYWSPFGHAVIFIGVEIGAVGVLTLASILGLVVSRRLGLRQKLMAATAILHEFRRARS